MIKIEFELEQYLCDMTWNWIKIHLALLFTPDKKITHPPPKSLSVAAWSVGVARWKVGLVGPAPSGMIRARGVLLRFPRWRDDWATWGASESERFSRGRFCGESRVGGADQEEKKKKKKHLSAAGKSLTHLTPLTLSHNFMQELMDDLKLTGRGWQFLLFIVIIIIIACYYWRY